ncbi:NADH-quinone oxidoreductase subunit L [Baekduia sp.]|jgi:NADH-quinone oxidoreductase subunit L|uniref:NADH-quinone oxidoreductase subunit L n=1 Tax=Baekduia sp. TaxID=2600305 RepID=UPI002E048526|nr:NADH-quinone oxidoreductase subunit L [Baekduia sp.]
MSPTTAAWLALACPLAGTIVNGLGYKLWKGRTAGVIGTAALAAAFVFALITLFSLQGRGEEHRQLVSSLYDYAVTGTIDAKMSILVDPLSILMMLVVTGVSTLIHVYSLAYMSGDRGYTRFFAYLNFFVFSMLLLVLAANFFLLIVGWAFVGAASYLLISFWYRRTTATSAGIKAFVINVVGDIGLTLGTFFILKNSHTLDFLGTFAQAKTLGADHHGDLTAGLILLLVGAFAKSAQLPFHTWLPDAMEGPTPVSALIHAATMVTAGVYLIARMHPLFEQSVAAADVGTIVGAVTLFVAATIGMVVTDLKRVIAYSTMSQIGYMIMGVSSGAYVAGLFHLMTHAFFKALLFMSAGSLISAMGGNQNLNDMRGFRKAMPFTFGCFVIGGLALSGVPPFSGFFSKDEILLFEAEAGGWHWILYVVGYLTALMTAVYTWRMIFRAFWGEPVEQARELEHGHLWHAPQPTNPATGEVEDTDVGFPGPEHHIAEWALPMKIAMGTLAVLATIGGVVLIPKTTTWLDTFLEPTFAGSTVVANPSNGLLWFGLALGAGLGLLGIFIAYRIWGKANGEIAVAIRERVPALHKLFVNKWYFDELIDWVVVRPFAWFGRFGQQTFERIFVNGALIGGPSTLVRAGSAAVRAVQSGFLRAYAALLLVGAGAVILYFLIQSS